MWSVHDAQFLKWGCKQNILVILQPYLAFLDFQFFMANHWREQLISATTRNDHTAQLVKPRSWLNPNFHPVLAIRCWTVCHVLRFGCQLERKQRFVHGDVLYFIFILCSVVSCPHWPCSPQVTPFSPRNTGNHPLSFGLWWSWKCCQNSCWIAICFFFFSSCFVLRTSTWWSSCDLASRAPGLFGWIPSWAFIDVAVVFDGGNFMSRSELHNQTSAVTGCWKKNVKAY